MRETSPDPPCPVDDNKKNYNLFIFETTTTTTTTEKHIHTHPNVQLHARAVDVQPLDQKRRLDRRNVARVELVVAVANRQ